MKIKLKKSEKNDIMNAFSMLSQIGLVIVITLFLCFFAGRWIDKALGTSPIFLFVFIVYGVLSGYWSIYKLVMRYIGGKDG
ncbi:MAG: AtpZ/AtpI family protein [Defluviitaleaceae bacterium]|nr:AtpZ/AtpI family protein [Defluviitaleaceae bacterium]